jgi:predicted lipoprotein with Yx(FWY)xxD motif
MLTSKESIIASLSVVARLLIRKKQLTFKGHPLYNFGQDAKRCDTKRVSVPAPGVWPVLTLNTPALLP